MDFITGIPKFEGNNAIVVVVDKLTKYAHFSLFIIILKQVQQLQHSWKYLRSCMESPRLLKVIEIQFSLVIFGQNYFLVWVLN
jgi:hypothetical protein